MVDMSKFSITDATEMPRQTRTRTPRANPFTKALQDSDAERHDETVNGKAVSLGKPKQTGVLSTVKPDGGGPSDLETARNLVRRAGKDAEIGVVTRIQPVDNNSAILVFQASDRRILQPLPREAMRAALDGGEHPDKGAAQTIIDAAKTATAKITGTNPPATDKKDSATTHAGTSRSRADARR